MNDHALRLEQALAMRGMRESEVSAKADLLAHCRRIIPEAATALYVPGRLEFLGKHTDYAGGRSLVCAVERGLVFLARPRDDLTVRVVDAVSGDSTTIHSPPQALPADTWATYPRTAVERLRANFPGAIRGAEIAFASDLPVAAGLSSSSALVTGITLALATLSGLEEVPTYHALRQGYALADYLGAVENGSDYGALRGGTGVGTRGGSQDHAALLYSVPGHLVQFRFAPIERESGIPLPPSHEFVIAASGRRAEKTGAARQPYNRIVETTRRITELLPAAHRGKPLLRVLDREPDLETSLREELSRRATRDPGWRAALSRFEQVMMESGVLVPEAARALARKELGALSHAVEVSQMLAERLLENQVPETVALVRLAQERGALAASSFGAGFGGSVWALLPGPDAERFREAWRLEYLHQFPAHAGQAQFFRSGAGPGVTTV